jgi:hypothetical protein
VIRLLLLCYPRAWRRRYGGELEQLVADSGLSWSVAVDLIRAGLEERGRAVRSALTGGSGMVIGPAWRHPTGLALLALVVVSPTMLFVVGSLLAYQFGVEGLRSPIDSVNQFLAGRRIIDLALVISPAIALVLAVAPLVRLDLRDGGSGREAVVGIRLRLANVLVGATALVIGALLVWHIVVESVMEVGP